MKQGQGHYLGIKAGDLEGKPYAKYWNPDMSPLPAEVASAVVHGPQAGELGLAFADARALLAPGYLALENGYTVLPDGQVFVAVRTEMPRVSGDMFSWWMGWHYMEHQRYKLWHPLAHVANGTQDMRGDDPHLSDIEKYQTTHFVTEYVGSRLEKLAITFEPPETFLGNEIDVASGHTTAFVCGRVGLQNVGLSAGHLIHQVRTIDGGSEMRSRFWLGRPQFDAFSASDWRNRLLTALPLHRLLLAKNVGQELLVHCSMEMNHLARFLPDLYADYHPNDRALDRAESV